MIGKLKTLFNPDFVSEHAGSLTITEKDKQAQVKTVCIKQGNFISLNNEILDKMNPLFETKSECFSLCKGCDGIFMYTHEDEKYIFLLELKSNYTKDQISKARSQIEASYVKLIMLLNSIEGFQIDDYKYRALIVSIEPKTETLSNLTKRIQIASGYSMERFCLNLYQAKKKGLKIKSENSLLKQLPLKAAYRFNELPIYFIPFTDQEIDITPYL